MGWECGGFDPSTQLKETAGEVPAVSYQAAGFKS